jgi:hypothetical protein
MMSLCRVEWRRRKTCASAVTYRKTSERNRSSDRHHNPRGATPFPPAGSRERKKKQRFSKALPENILTIAQTLGPYPVACTYMQATPDLHRSISKSSSSL